MLLGLHTHILNLREVMFFPQMLCRSVIVCLIIAYVTKTFHSQVFWFCVQIAALYYWGVFWGCLITTFTTTQPLPLNIDDGWLIIIQVGFLPQPYPSNALTQQDIKRISSKKCRFWINYVATVQFIKPIIKMTLSPLLSPEADTVDLGVCADAWQGKKKKVIFRTEGAGILDAVRRDRQLNRCTCHSQITARNQ